MKHFKTERVITEIKLIEIIWDNEKVTIHEIEPKIILSGTPSNNKIIRDYKKKHGLPIESRFQVIERKETTTTNYKYYKETEV